MVRLIAVLVAVSLTGACGSTVAVRDTAALTAGAGDGLGAAPTDPGIGESTAGASGLGGVAGAAPGGPSTVLPTTVGPGRGVTLPLATTGAPRPTVAQGSRTGPILVGVPYIDADEANAFVGSVGTGLATGDSKAAIGDRIARVNAAGGVLGRPLKAVYHQVDPNSSPAQYQQAACQAFTKDQKVSYVLDFGLGDGFWACTAKAGVGVLNIEQALLTRKGLARFPGLVIPNAVALDRLSEEQAERFTAMGFLGKGSKVGILYYDHPEFEAAEKVLEAELAKRGIEVAARQALHYIASTSDVAQTSSQANGAVLNFRSAGVTHVLAVEQNAFLTGLFGLAAASQSYYPRYGYTSAEPLGNIAANVPARALEGAAFFGWTPVSDVPDLTQLSPAGRACLKSFSGRQAQETPNQRSTLVKACEQVDLLAAAVTAAGSSAGASSLVAGLAALRGYASAATFAVSHVGRRADGASQARNGRWDGEKFVYTSAASAL